jgi:uncharacterized protein YggE
MKRTVSVVGSAVVFVAPDCARLNCGVQVRGSNAQDALRRSNEAMHAIIDALKRNGVDAADIRTTGPTLHPGEKGYFGGNDVAVTVRALDSLGAVIDAVALAGGPNLTMHGVSFSVSDPGSHQPAARRAAMQAAHAAAVELANAAGAAVGEVLTIEESSGYQAPVPMVAGMSMMKATPVEGGTQEIHVDVNVTYRLIEPG